MKWLFNIPEQASVRAFITTLTADVIALAATRSSPDVIFTLASLDFFVWTTPSLHPGYNPFEISNLWCPYSWLHALMKRAYFYLFIKLNYCCQIWILHIPDSLEYSPWSLNLELQKHLNLERSRLLKTKLSHFFEAGYSWSSVSEDSMSMESTNHTLKIF